MKSFKKIFLMLTSFAMVVGTLLIGGGIKKTEQVEAAGQKTYVMTIDSSDRGYNNVHYTSSTRTKPLTYNGASWNVEVAGTSSITSSKTYCQIGSQKNPASNVTFSTSYFANKQIISASLDCYCMTNTGPKLSIKAGSTFILEGSSLQKTNRKTHTSTNESPVILTETDTLDFIISSSAKAAICISKFTVVYADLEVKYNVTYDLNGGKLSDGSTQITIDPVKEGLPLSNPGELTHKENVDKKFMGWYYTDSNGLSKEWNFAEDTVTSNLTLTAKWGYEVTINPNNGGATETKNVLEGTKISELVPTETPEKGGYNFAGWKKFIGTEASDITDADLVNSKLEIRADWTEITTPLVFIETEHEIHSDIVEYYVDQEFTLSAVVQHATATSYIWKIEEDDLNNPVLTNLSNSLNTKDIKFKANKIGDIYISISVSISESSEPISHELIVSITHPVKDIATSAWLGISYNEIKSETITYNIATMAAAANPKWQEGDNIGVSKDFPEGRNDLVFTATNGSTPTRYWGDDTWRFYKGATLKIESTDKKISSITIDGNKTVVNNNIFNKSFSDTTKIKEIIVELEGSITFTNIRARFGITIPKDTYQFDSIKSANVSFKVNIAGSEKIQTITMSDDKMTINDDGSITYVVSVVNIPLANCKDVIHVVPTITINGHSYDLAGTSYSVYGMVEDYLLQDAFADNVYLNALYSAIDEATTTTGA